MTDHSQKFLKHRKFMIMLPILVFPFITILFWLSGGGKGKQVSGSLKKGLNTQLPDSKPSSTSAMDKLGFYAMADRDSVKRNEQLRMDPNVEAQHTEVSKRKEDVYDEELIHHKVERIQKMINTQPKNNGQERGNYQVEEPNDKIEEVTSLSAGQKTISHNREPDPEIEALNVTLDKLLDVQHPDRVKERLSPKPKNVYSVTTEIEEGDNGFFGKSDTTQKGTAFYSDYKLAADTKPGSIIAVMHGVQNFQAGFVAKLRLLRGIVIDGVKIPAGSFIYGSTTIDEERLKISITSIQYEHRLFPVAMTVYDLDGLEGIYIPGSETREAVKESADQGIQSLNGLSLNQSIPSQAAAAGIGAAKSLLSKKVKMVRVTVKAGYMVLLKDANLRNQ